MPKHTPNAIDRTLPSQGRRGLLAAISSTISSSGLLAAAGAPAFGQGQPTPAAPTPVTVVTIQPRPITLTTELPGRTSAFRVAEIRPQVTGVIQDRLFTEGGSVTAGQQLYQVDPAPYRAALASAQAAQQKAVATLNSARLTANRYRPLVQARAVSALDYDNAVAAQQQAEADLAAAEAAVETAQINLDYTRVVAPIGGRTSRSAVTPGALVTANQTTSLVTITQLDPILVDVVQPISVLLRLRRASAEGRLRRAAEDATSVTLTLEDGSDYPEAGRLQFTEVTVDQGTGSVILRLVFPNPDGMLMPGMFVRARLEEGVQDDALLVPQQAVTRDAQGKAVAMVIQPDGTVAPRVLTTGRVVGASWLVTAGLRAGERVVVEGLQRIRPGTRVVATEMAERLAARP